MSLNYLFNLCDVFDLSYISVSFEEHSVLVLQTYKHKATYTPKSYACEQANLDDNMAILT